MRAEAVVFKRYLDEAVEIKSRMTELEDEVHQGSRHEQPMAAGEFHQRSREFSKRIDALKGQFDKKFGASLNEYPGGFNNPNHRLYLNTAGALSALRAVWLDWHHSILGDQPSAKGDLASSEEQFWNDTNAALERIEQLKGPPPDAKNSTSKDS
jgi:hypothetical protein